MGRDVSDLSVLLAQMRAAAVKAEGGDCDICDEHDDERRRHWVEGTLLLVCRRCFKEVDGV